MTFYHTPRGKSLCRRPGVLGTPPGPFFHKIHFHISLASRGAQSGAKDGPKCSKGAKQEPQSSLARAKTVTFRCQIGESGPLLKHQQGLCFHHIIRVRAPDFLLLNSPRERTAHRELFFSHFWLHFWHPSGTQGRPKGAQKGPKGVPKPPLGRLKFIKNRPGTPPGYSRESGRLQGYPRDGKRHQNQQKKQKRRAFRLIF